jgi:hypothetical protein
MTRRGVLGAVETTLAVTATVLLVAAVDPSPGPLVLGAVLAMTLSRSHLVDSWRGRLEAVVVLPALAVIVALVALLLLDLPVVGAAAFTAAMFLSVWLRRFGPTWRRIGSLVALPFITLLIAPAHLGSGGVLEAALVSLVALAAVVLLRLAFRRRAATVAPPSGAPSAAAASDLRPIPSTRMALQLALAVGAAFALGYWLFPGHWGWVVLTAYLVCSGNRGRADVLYKSGLRVVGAAAGTVAALALAGVRLEGPVLVAVLIAALAVGLVLREVSYAFWALIITLVLTLLQSGLGAEAVDLPARLLAILVGAACGLVASWFLLPIRSERVVRGRVAAVLAGLDDVATGRGATPSLHPLDEVAPPFVFLARIPLAPPRWRRTGEWILAVRQIAPLVVDGSALPELRAARRAMREPEAVRGALAELLAALRR